MSFIRIVLFYLPLCVSYSMTRFNKASLFFLFYSNTNNKQVHRKKIINNKKKFVMTSLLEVCL